MNTRQGYGKALLMPLHNPTLLRMLSAVDLHHNASIRRSSAYRGEPFPCHQGNGEASLVGITPALGHPNPGKQDSPLSHAAQTG